MTGILQCRRCWHVLTVVETAYGHRAACFACDIRWTRIRGETTWAAERR